MQGVPEPASVINASVFHAKDQCNRRKIKLRKSAILARKFTRHDANIVMGIYWGRDILGI